jgi:hypothetical protein
VSLEVDDAALQRFRHYWMLGDLVREDGIPKGHVSGTDLLPSKGHDLRERDRLRFGKGFKDRVQAEEMVAVTVGDVDGRQCFPFGADPLDDAVGLRIRYQGIDQNRFLLAGKKRYGTRRLGSLLGIVP